MFLCCVVWCTVFRFVLMHGLMHYLFIASVCVIIYCLPCTMFMLFDARVLKALFRTSVCAKYLSLSQDGQGCCFNHLLVFKFDGLCVCVCSIFGCCFSTHFWPESIIQRLHIVLRETQNGLLLFFITKAVQVSKLWRMTGFYLVLCC